MSRFSQVEHALSALQPFRSVAVPVGRLTGTRGPLLFASGLRCPVGTGLSIDPGVEAEVIGFEGDATVLIPLSNECAPRPGARVQGLGPALAAGVGGALLGRVIDAQGRPVDGCGPVLTDLRRDLGGTLRSPLARGSVTKSFASGVRAIDALTTLGRGQRVILAAGSGIGKSTLIHQIIDGAEADVIVVALIGERNREIADFVTATRAGRAFTRTVTVAVPGDRSPLLRIRAAQRATTIAEHFSALGKNVLLIVDSLTRVAHAQRELGLALGETPTMKGYPASALALIPQLIERCGCDVASGGSITALYTVLADGDDVDDPVVDSARAIADGHIILSRSLAEQGIFPAIDIARSLSRVMTDIVSADHRAAAVHLRRLWAVAEENRDLVLMGAYQPGQDPFVDEALDARGRILDFLAQPAGERIAMQDAIAALKQGFAA